MQGRERGFGEPHPSASPMPSCPMLKTPLQAANRQGKVNGGNSLEPQQLPSPPHLSLS